ncbi:MAG: cytochrome c peroxidase, partial [Polyangiaceae bacterium]
MRSACSSSDDNSLSGAGGSSATAGTAGTQGTAGFGGIGGNAASAGSSGAGAGAGGSTAGAGGSGVDSCSLWTAPEGSDIDQTFENFSLLKLTGEQEEAFTFHGLRADCEHPGLLVVRVEPAWCEPCGLRADRFGMLAALFPSEVIDPVTVLYAGPDNAHPTAGDLIAWRSAHLTLPGALARSPDGAAGELVRLLRTIPMVFLVDRRTMRILSAMDDPDDQLLVIGISDALAAAGGPLVTPTLDPAPPRRDGRFDEHQWQLIQRMAAPLVLPPSLSNAYADDVAAAALGEQLFHDEMLAGPGGISCATCHVKDKGFADGLPTAIGLATGNINTPGIATSAWNRWQFWDGRADSLWSQALGPLENPLETGGSRLHVAHHIQATYAAAYEPVFGTLPPLDDTQRFPLDGKPGDPAYDGMALADQQSVTRVFVNVGKAIEAFERTLRPAPMRLSAYAGGDTEALSPTERDGLLQYLESGCANCHGGPTLTNSIFANILMPSNSPTGPGDRGRIDGAMKLLASPFRADGPYSDNPEVGAALASLVVGDEMLGQIKTPSLRGVTTTGPWGHGGTFQQLDGVVKHYGQ